MPVTKPTVSIWNSKTSGAWGVGRNWKPGHAPSNGDSVIITPAAPLTVTLNLTAPLSLASLTVTGATLSFGAGYGLSVSGAATLDHVAIVDTVVGNGYSVPKLILKGAMAVSALTLGGYASLENDGVVTQNGAVQIDSLNTKVGAIQNYGTWTLAGANAISQSNLTDFGFLNRGQFKKTGDGTANFGANLANAGPGSIEVASGTLALSGDYDNLAGSVFGAGVLEVKRGAVGIESYANFSVANWVLSGGATFAGQSRYSGNFTGYAGATLVAGQLELAGTNLFSGLTIASANYPLTNMTVNTQVVLTGATTVTGLTLSGHKVQISACSSVVQSGDVTLGDMVSGDTANLQIGAGGVWTLSGGVKILQPALYGSFITIGEPFGSGLLLKAGGGTAVVAPTVLNNVSNSMTNGQVSYGGIKVESGTLDIKGGVYGMGSASIVGASTLEFDNKVDTRQNIVFAGSHGGTLFLTDLQDFYGSVSAFAAGGAQDRIKVLGIDNVRTTAQTSSSTTLFISNTQNTAGYSLTLQGDYTNGVFSTSSDWFSNTTSIGFTPNMH